MPLSGSRGATGSTTCRSRSSATRSSPSDLPASPCPIPSTSGCSCVRTTPPLRSAPRSATSASRRPHSHGRLGGTMSRIGVAGGICLCLLLPRLNGGSSPVPPQLPSSLIEHDTTVAAQQPGPHGGGGVTTAYPFFAGAPNLQLVFRKRAVSHGSAIGYHRHAEGEIYYL